MEPTATAQPTGDTAAAISSAVRKAAIRLVPFLGLLYLINYLDRANVGYAALTMNADLGLTTAAYGLGAGLFFIGYFFFEVPSNIILHKVGARVWIARIMITWGIVASCTSFIQGEISFYIVRVLLGIAEAGFFPGIVLYLTYWFPRAKRANILALVLLAVPLSSVVGGPVSTFLIENGNGALGFAEGWRFMFFVEGLPAVLLGVVVLFVLPSRPRDAKWLTEEERTALTQTIADEDRREITAETSLRAGLASPRVLALSVAYFALSFGFIALGFFLPQVVQGFQEDFGVTYSLFEIGVITAIPFAFAAVTMVIWARHSDRTGERALHVAIPSFIGAVAIAAALYMNSPLMVMVCVTVFTMCAFAVFAPLWQLPLLLSGAGAAAGIAMINSLGNLSGFASGYVVGWLEDWTGSFRPGMWVGAGFMALAGVIALTFRRLPASAEPRTQPETEPTDQLDREPAA